MTFTGPSNVDGFCSCKQVYESLKQVTSDVLNSSKNTKVETKPELVTLEKENTKQQGLGKIPGNKRNHSLWVTGASEFFPADVPEKVIQHR